MNSLTAEQVGDWIGPRLGFAIAFPVVAVLTILVGLGLAIGYTFNIGIKWQQRIFHLTKCVALGQCNSGSRWHRWLERFEWSLYLRFGRIGGILGFWAFILIAFPLDVLIPFKDEARRLLATRTKYETT